MKIRLLLILALTVSGLFSGCCVKDQLQVAENSIRVMIERDETRTSVTDAGIFTWSAGDQIWLQTTSGSVLGTLSSGAGAETATFVYGSFIGDLTGKAIYPYDASHSLSDDQLSIVLPASYDLGPNLTNTNVAMYGREVNGTIRFNHLAGLMRFVFKNTPAGTDRFQITLDKKISGTFSADLSAAVPVIKTEKAASDSEKTVTLCFDPLAETSDISLYVPLPSGTYSSIALSLWAGNQSVFQYSNTVTNTVNRKSLLLMPAVTLGGSIEGDIEVDDSSEPKEPVDIDLSESGHANSYIVSAAGTYHFRPSKGSSFYPVENISYVEVLWESFGTDQPPTEGDLIRNLNYKDGVISFETPDTLVEGNAVIGAKSANGTILWSWHIWLTDKPKEYISPNDAGTTMDRNLGATSAVPGDAGALGLMYEWGRKDPFLGSSSIREPILAKSTNTWYEVSCSNSSVGSIDYSVRNPMTFIKAGDYYDWLYYDHYGQVDRSRWGKEKTIYDPCPSGWKVPDVVFYYASRFHTQSNGYDSEKYGRRFSNNGVEVWYPNTGQLLSLNSFTYFDYGLYWTSSPQSSADFAYVNTFFFSSGYIDYDGLFEAARAQAVRCVKDEASIVKGDLITYPSPSYSVELSTSVSPYGWKKSTTVVNPNPSYYDGVYESTNQGVHNSYSLMYIDITGYKKFRLYIRSYAELYEDYVVVSDLDGILSGSASGGKESTSFRQTSDTSIDGYTLVEFTDIDRGTHRISIMYKKDDDFNEGDDKGYVLIPKHQ